jgi:hypothetical protein
MWVGLVVIGALFLALGAALVGLALHSQRVEVALLIESVRGGQGQPAAATGWSTRVRLAIAAAGAVILGLVALGAAVAVLPD